MSRVALPRIGGIIAARSDADRRRSRRGATGSRTAPTPRSRPTRRRSPTPAAAQALASETRDKLTAEAEEPPQDARGRAAISKLAEAEKTIAATKTAAMANVQGIAVDAAAAIVERLIGTRCPDKDVADAVADVLKR